MQSSAPSVAAYLAELPDDRRKALKTLRTLIRKLAPDAKESMQYGMPTYTLNGPLFGLASQKNFMAVYCCRTEVVDRHRPRLGKLNCGKGCLRFKQLADLPLDVIEDILREAAQCQRQEAARITSAASSDAGAGSRRCLCR